MKNTTKTILILSLIPAISFALTQAQMDAMYQSDIKELEKRGLPTPGSGLQLVPSDPSKKKSILESEANIKRLEMQKNGYVSETSDRAYELLHIEEKIKKYAEIESKMSRASDTYLRKSADELPLAYTYFGVPKEEAKNFFGIAPAGSYQEEKGKQIGWTGASAFFQTSFGICAYTENNMILQGSAVRLPEEFVTYDVNEKITVINIKGNESSGFLYHINWFDSVLNHNLECATKKYSETNKADTINLAKKIDTYNQASAQ